MPNINLLPWRERKRQQEKKLFFAFFSGSVFLALLIVFFMNYFVCNLVANQIMRNRMLEKEITAYAQELNEIKILEATRNNLIAQTHVIFNFQSGRSLMAHLFTELINVIPAEVYLTRIEGINNSIMVSGYAESNTAVSQTMNKMEQSKWLHNPVLHEIKRVKAKNQPANNRFKLIATLAPETVARNNIKAEQ